MGAREALLRQGRLSDAIAVLRLETELRPHDFGLYRLLCRTLGDAGLLEEGLNYLKALAGHIADNPPLDRPASLDLIDETVLNARAGIWSTLPEHDDVDLLLFAMRLPSYSLAQTICRRLLDRFPDAAALVYLSAVILRLKSRLDLRQNGDMLQSLEKLFTAEPQFCLEMGLVHRDRGNFAAALIWLNRARARSDAPSPAVFHQLGKTQVALGDYAAAAQSLKQAIALKPDLVDAYIDLHESLLAEERVPEAIEAFDTALRAGALSALRGVHVHPALMSGTADFMATQANAIRRGVPSIMLNSLGNSGSTYVMLRLVAGLHIPGHSILLGQFDTRDRPIPEAVANMAKGGAICRQHFYATEEILALFRQHNIEEMILQIRDPRQLVLSNLHYIEMLYADGSYVPSRSRAAFTKDYFEWPMEAKLDYLIDNFIPRDTGMIQSWIDAEEAWPDLRIHYCTYESMVDDPDEFLRDILDFYDIPHDRFNWSARVDKSEAHFRKGKIDEWRGTFSERQKHRAWELMPEALSQRFEWRQ
jgi:tetratricopeptide (TPR) repeat protein